MEWLVSDDKILGIKAMQHRITKELCLFGKYGEVWVDGNHYKVLARGKIKTKVAQLLQHRSSIGTLECELMLPFTEAEAAAILEVVGIFKTLSAQERVANEGNEDKKGLAKRSDHTSH